MKKLDRRDFIKKSTLTAAAISSTPLLSSCVNNPSKKHEYENYLIQYTHRV